MEQLLARLARSGASATVAPPAETAGPEGEEDSCFATGRRWLQPHVLRPSRMAHENVDWKEILHKQGDSAAAMSGCLTVGVESGNCEELVEGEGEAVEAQELAGTCEGHLLSTADNSQRRKTVSRIPESLAEACDGRGSPQSGTELAQDYGADSPPHLEVEAI